MHELCYSYKCVMSGFLKGCHKKVCMNQFCQSNQLKLTLHRGVNFHVGSKTNQTICYHRYVFHLPNLVKMQFQNMKTFFPQENTFSSCYSLIFPTLEVRFFFRQKNLILRAEFNFLGNNTI